MKTTRIKLCCLHTLCYCYKVMLFYQTEISTSKHTVVVTFRLKCLETCVNYEYILQTCWQYLAILNNKPQAKQRSKYNSYVAKQVTHFSKPTHGETDELVLGRNIVLLWHNLHCFFVILFSNRHNQRCYFFSPQYKFLRQITVAK